MGNSARRGGGRIPEVFGGYGVRGGSQGAALGPLWGILGGSVPSGPLRLWGSHQHPPPPPGPRGAALSLLGCLGGGVLLGTALLDLLPTYLGSIGAALRELRIPVRDSGEGVGVWDGMGGRGGAGMD